MNSTVNGKNHVKRSSFTLIELLIVVSLLGALAALMLPSMRASRTKAMEATCDYNQASTMKTLTDHYALNGCLPDNLHTGASAALTGTDPVEADLMGLPGDSDGSGESGNTLDNMLNNVTSTQLTDATLASLNAAGITKLTYDDGTESTPLTTSAYVLAMDVDTAGTGGWRDDSGAAITFDGKHLSDWVTNDAACGGAAGIIIPLYVSQATEWTTEGDNDWGKSIDAEISAKKAGQCKVPTDADFDYYIAYIKAFSAYDDETLDGADGGDPIPAILVGTSCPECGVTNP